MSRFAKAPFQRGPTKEVTNVTYSKIKSKKFKLAGWDVEYEPEEIDLTDWSAAKRRQETNIESGRTVLNDSDIYRCSVIRKCKAIQDIQTFVDQSLSVRFAPKTTSIYRQRTEVPRAGQRGGQQRAAGMKKVQSVGGALETMSIVGERSEKGDDLESISTVTHTLVAESHDESAGDVDIAKFKPRDGMCDEDSIPPARPPTRESWVEQAVQRGSKRAKKAAVKGDKEVSRENDSGFISQESDKSQEGLNCDQDTYDIKLSEEEDGGDIGAHPGTESVLGTLPKFGYTNANDGRPKVASGKPLHSPRDVKGPMLLFDASFLGPATAQLPKLKPWRRAKTAAEDMAAAGKSETGSDAVEAGFSGIEGKSSKSQSAAMTFRPMTLREFTANLPENSPTHKLMEKMGILPPKKDSKESADNAGTDAKLRNITTGHGESNLTRIDRSGTLATIARQAVPLGELLPAMETSLTNPLPVRYQRSMLPDVRREQTTMLGGSPSIVAENTTLLQRMRQGLETFQERQHTDLGGKESPHNLKYAFRSPQGKSALQRTRETAKKRISAQLLPLQSHRSDAMTPASEPPTNPYFDKSASTLGASPYHPSFKSSTASRISRRWRSENIVTSSQPQQFSKRAPLPKLLPSRLAADP